MPYNSTDIRDYRILLGGGLGEYGAGPLELPNYTRFTYREALNRPGGWILEAPKDKQEQALRTMFAGSGWCGVALLNLTTGEYEFTAPQYPKNDQTEYHEDVRNLGVNQVVWRGPTWLGALNWRVVYPPSGFSHWEINGVADIADAVHSMLKANCGDYPTTYLQRRLLGTDIGSSNVTTSGVTANGAFRYTPLLDSVTALIDAWVRAGGESVFVKTLFSVAGVDPFFPTGGRGGPGRTTLEVSSYNDTGKTYTLNNGLLSERTISALTIRGSEVIVLADGTGDTRFVRTNVNAGIPEASGWERVEKIVDMGTGTTISYQIGARTRAELEEGSVSQEVYLGENGHNLNIGDVIWVWDPSLEDYSQLVVTEKVVTLENGQVVRKVSLGGVGISDEIVNRSLNLPTYE